MKTEIKKAKITNQSTLEVTLIEYAENDVTNEVVKKCGNLVHEDMRLAFKALSGHMAMLCDLKESVGLDLSDPEHAATLDKIYVTSFSVGGNDDNEGVCLVGGKKLASGKVLNLVAPFQKYEDEEYKLSYALEEDVNLCIKEVEAYLYDNKCAVRQLDLFDDAEGESVAGDDTVNVTISSEGMPDIKTTGKAIRMTAKNLEAKAEASGF